jgi:SAM-dependent methyltransferase
MQLKMRKKESTRHLNFLSGFDDNAPDAYHHIDLDYAKGWIEGKRVLNIGCWTGSFESISSNFPNQYFALDQEPEALRIAKSNNPNVLFVNGDALFLPFRDNSIEVVLLFTVFEHFEGKEDGALREINRVLVPGGKFILSTPHSHWLHSMMDIAHWLLKHRHFCMDEIKEYLFNSGFSIVSLHTKGAWVSTFFIPLFYLGKYIFRNNLYKSNWYKRILIKEYQREGFRDIYLVAKKHKDV